MRRFVVASLCAAFAVLQMEAASAQGVPLKPLVSADEMRAFWRAGRLTAIAPGSDGGDTFVLRSSRFDATYRHIALAGKHLPRAFRRADFYILTALDVRQSVLRVPEIRYQTRFVDRIVEKPVEVRVEVPVEVVREVFVDRPVLKTVDRPVPHYIERPVLPSSGVALLLVIGALTAGAFGYSAGAHMERRRIQRFRLTLPELSNLTEEARRVADGHIRSVQRLLGARANVDHQ